MRVFFFGTPEYAVPSLEGLVAAGHEVVGVMCQEDKPVGRKRVLTAPPIKVCAQKKGISVLQPAKVSQANNEIASLKPDLFVVVAFGKLIPQSTLDLSPLPPINAHASLLPKYRGAAPAERALMDGETETGVSVMQVVKELDAGPVLMVKKTPITPDMNRLEILEVLSKLSPVALLEGIEIIEKGGYVFEEQDHENHTYAPKILREDGALNWDLSAESIYNQFRGVTPFPGAYGYVYIGEKDQKVMVKIESMQRSSHLASGKPGSILSCNSDNVLVACGEGSLEITTVKPQGKRSMSPGDFANGYRLKKGDAFTKE